MSDLGDRMKRYELATKQYLPPRAYGVLRVDGRAFHSWTRGAGITRPFSTTFAAIMDNTAGALLRDVVGARLAYVQSDEISVVFDDCHGRTAENWFGGEVQKITSVAASRATAKFNQLVQEELVSRRPAMFDARVFTIASPLEVGNYLLWRIRDAERNSISMAAQSYFSHNELQGITGLGMREMLQTKYNINWDHYPERFKYGRLVLPIKREEEVEYTDKRTNEISTTMAIRRYWENFCPIREFDASAVRYYLNDLDERDIPAFAVTDE